MGSSPTLVKFIFWFFISFCLQEKLVLSARYLPRFRLRCLEDLRQFRSDYLHSLNQSLAGLQLSLMHPQALYRQVHGLEKLSANLRRYSKLYSENCNMPSRISNTECEHWRSDGFNQGARMDI